MATKPIWEPESKKLRLYGARLSFPNLWHARAFTEGQEPKYSASFVLPKDSESARAALKAAKDLALEAFKKADGVKLCVQDGAVKEHVAGYGPGTVFVNANSTSRPLVVDRDQSVLAEGDGRPYGGCYVTGLVRLWVQNNQFGRRVNAELLGVQFIRDGEPFVGGAPASPSDFEVEEVEEDAPWDA